MTICVYSAMPMGHAVKVYAASCFSSATLLISAQHLRMTRVTRPFNYPRIFRGGEKGGKISMVAILFSAILSPTSLMIYYLLYIFIYYEKN